MTATEYVVLVDSDDREIGIAPKMEAHQKGLLHRAFSVFIFNTTTNELLLQQRADHKYHSPGLWTNACCSHPRHNESILEAGKRRLKEELGLITSLKQVGTFQYQAYFENGLSENELDHLLIGAISNQTRFHPNPDEVKAIRWITRDALQHELKTHPHQFTPWLLLALEKLSAVDWKTVTKR